MIYHYRHQSTEEESTESLLQLAWSGQCTRCHPLRDAYCGFLPWGVGGGPSVRDYSQSPSIQTLFFIILLHEKFLQFDWLRAVVFQLNLKYLHVKITTFCEL